MICARGSHAGGKRVKDTIADAEIGHRPYPVAVDFQPVRDAYSSLSEEYIALYDGDWLHEDEGSLIRRHLTGLPGAVLDVGCGPGYWTAHLHSLGVEVTGVDLVPEFIAHARATHPGVEFRLGSMTDLDVPEHSVAGVLAWYSTIHLPPGDLDRTLAGGLCLSRRVDPALSGPTGLPASDRGRRLHRRALSQPEFRNRLHPHRCPSRPFRAARCCPTHPALMSRK